nr:aquaporin-like protein [Thecaphora frezii]
MQRATSSRSIRAPGPVAYGGDPYIISQDRPAHTPSAYEMARDDMSAASHGNRSYSGSHPPGHGLVRNGTNMSFGGQTSGTGIELPSNPIVAQPDEADVMEQQLPDFMRIDAKGIDKHRHPQGYREALRRRLEIKNNAVAFLSEFVGTVLFLFFSFGIATEASNARSALQNTDVSQNTQSLSQNAPPDTSALLYSSLGFGFSLAVNAWTFYRVSGGLFNPAVTLALTLTKALNWVQCLWLTIAQICGGIAAAALTDAIIPGPVNARTTLSSGISVAQGFWLEFFLTAQLIFAIFLLAVEKHRATFLAPIGIGLSLFISELFGTNYTGGSLNPARSFGPDVVLGRFDSYHWIYWVAPYSAAVVTTGFYMLLKYLQYETVNSGQDADEVRQVFRDAYGNIVGSLDTVDAHDFKFLDQAADDAVAALVGGGLVEELEVVRVDGVERTDNVAVGVAENLADLVSVLA